MLKLDWDRFVANTAFDRCSSWEEPESYLYRTCFDSFCMAVDSIRNDPRFPDETRDAESNEALRRQLSDISFHCASILKPRNVVGDVDLDARDNMRGFIQGYYGARTYDFVVSLAKLRPEAEWTIGEEDRIAAPRPHARC